MELLSLLLKYLPDEAEGAKKGRSRWWLGVYPPTSIIFPAAERIKQLAEMHMARYQFELIHAQDNHVLFRINTKSSLKTRENFRRAIAVESKIL